MSRSIQPSEGPLKVYCKWKEGLLEEDAKLILGLNEGHVHFVPILSKSPMNKNVLK